MREIDNTVDTIVILALLALEHHQCHNGNQAVPPYPLMLDAEICKETFRLTWIDDC